MAYRPNKSYQKPKMERDIVCRLVTQNHNFFDKIEDISKINDFEADYIKLLGLMKKYPNIVMADYLKSNPQYTWAVCKGSIIGFLCDPIHASHYSNFLVASSMPDNWQHTLTSMNRIIYDTYIYLQPIVRIRFVDLIELILLHNPPHFDSVFLNYIKENNAGERLGDLKHILQVTELLCEMILRNKEWFIRGVFNHPVMPCLLFTFSRFLADLPAANQGDRVHQLLCSVIDLVLRERFRDLTYMGRELLFVLLRLSKVPMFRGYWKTLLHNPNLMFEAGMDNIPKLMAQKCSQPVVVVRLAFKLSNFIDYMVTYKPEVVEKYHADWFIKEYLQGFDGCTLRADVIRFMISFKNYKNETVGPIRIIILFKLLTTCGSKLEFQMAKQALFYDWICSDYREAHHPNLSAHLEVFMGVVKHCLSNNVIDLANSLLDHLARFITEFYPNMSHIWITNFGNSLRALQQTQTGIGLLKMFEHPQIDKSIKNAFSILYPEFFARLFVAETPKPTLKEEDPLKKSDKSERKREAPPLDHPRPSKHARMEKSTNNKAGTSRPRLLLAVQLRENIPKLSNEVKKLFETMIKVLDLQGRESSEAYNAVNAFYTKIRVLKLDEEQNKLIASNFATILEPLLDTKTVYKDFKQTSKNILYAFLECWNTIKQQKRIQSDPLSSQLKEMYRLRPIIGPLLFLYSVEFKSVIDLYKTFHTVTGATLGGQLSKDLAICNAEDKQMLSFMVQKLHILFPDISGSVEFIEALCTEVGEAEVYSFSRYLIGPRLYLFQRDTFNDSVTRSLTWPYAAQSNFWNLVKLEQVPLYWLFDCLHLLQDRRDPTASTSIVSIVISKATEITNRLCKDLFYRHNDTLTVTLIRVLVTNSNIANGLARLTSKLLHRAHKRNAIFKAKKTSKSTTQSTFGTLDVILGHLDVIRKTAMKEELLTLYLKSEWFLKFAQEIQKKSQMEKLVKKFSDLFEFWSKYGTEKIKPAPKRATKPPTAQVPKRSSQLRRKKNIDYVELSDEDSD